MWSGIWSVVTSKIGLWTWIWSKRDWIGAGSGLLFSILEKLNWFRLIGVITLVLLIWKWMGLFLRKNHHLRCCGWLSFLNWIGTLTLSLLLKIPPIPLRLLYIFKNLPYGLAWNFIVISGLMLLVVTWICWISYKNGYARLLVLHSPLLLNPWLIVEMLPP